MRASSALTGPLALLLAAACSSPEPSPPATPRPAAARAPTPAPRLRLEPKLRLVDEDNARALGQRKVTGGLAVVDDVARPVLSVTKSLQNRASPCDVDGEDPYAPCRYEIKGSRTAAWLLVAPIPAPETSGARTALRDAVGGPLRPRPHLVLPNVREGQEFVVPRHDAGPVDVREIPPLGKRWVETGAFEMPRNAVLRFSTALEPDALRIDGAPIRFEVLAHEGTIGRQNPIGLFQTVLDPATPEARRWTDHEIALEPVAGKLARLHFRTSPVDPNDDRPQLPLWGDPTILAPADERHANRPFVVLVSLDTLRARSLSALGSAVEASPHFDALARQGTLFEQAFTTYSNTLASHMSLLTGLWPQSHGVKGKGRLGSGSRTLAERMRTAGFVTAAFTENGLLNGAAGSRRGFGRYAENKEITLGTGASRKTFQTALAWVREHTDAPFFLFLHTYEVHAPYTPDDAYAQLFDEADLPGPAHRRYQQEIRYLDDQLRELVAGLDQILGAENLLLVITADHGEEFFEHGHSYHSQLYDEVMHVPLLFRWPTKVPADERIDTPVSLVDVAPTILQLAGVSGSRLADGQSLVALMHHAKGMGPRALFAEAPPSFTNDEQRQFVGRTATHKCMVPESRQPARCFDLERDPDERVALPPEHDDATRALYEQILAYRDAPGPAKEAPAAAPQEIDPKRAEKLRALGYVE